MRISISVTSLALGLSLASCETSPSDYGPAPTSQEVAALIDGYLLAYRDGLANGLLEPNPEIFAEARLAGSAFGPRIDRQARKIAHDTLDVAMGFDFVPPAEDQLLEYGFESEDERSRMGFFRSVPHHGDAVRLLDAARAGLTNALAAGLPQNLEGVTEVPNLAEARAPLAEFFASVEHYHPMHTGRCYPHGHEDYPGQMSLDPATCVAEHLARVAVVMQNTNWKNGLGPAPEELETDSAEIDTELGAAAGSCNCYWPSDCGWFSSCNWGAACSNSCDVEDSDVVIYTHFGIFCNKQNDGNCKNYFF